MTKLLVNIDVPDIEAARRFYTEAFGLSTGRRLGDDFLELVGAEAPLYLLLKREGTPPHEGSITSRDYRRHWSPVHLDLVVPDIHEAIARAVRAGATLERGAEQEPYGLLALLSDPFGHGFCFLQFTGRGYDEIVSTSA